MKKKTYTFQSSLSLNPTEDRNVRLVKTNRDGDSTDWILSHTVNGMMLIPTDLVMACVTRARQVPSFSEDPETASMTRLSGKLHPMDLLLLTVTQKIVKDFDPFTDDIYDWRMVVIGMASEGRGGKLWVFLWERWSFLEKNKLVIWKKMEKVRGKKKKSKFVPVPYYTGKTDFHMNEYWRLAAKEWGAGDEKELAESTSVA